MAAFAVAKVAPAAAALSTTAAVAAVPLLADAAAHERGGANPQVRDVGVLELDRRVQPLEAG